MWLDLPQVMTLRVRAHRTISNVRLKFGEAHMSGKLGGFVRDHVLYSVKGCYISCNLMYSISL